MTAPRTLARFLAEERGATAVEFALVSILFLTMMVGSVNMAEIVWEVSSCKAATRAAARYAIVNPPLSADLASFNAVTSLGYYAGQTVPASAVAVHTCTSSGCTCSGSGYCGTTTLNSTVFSTMVSLMQSYDSRIASSNVTVTYTPIGLGLAGNPYGPDVEPLVTVQLTGLTLSPGVLQAFGFSSFNLPSVASSLSGEDLS